MSAERLLSAHLMIEISLYMIRPGPRILSVNPSYPVQGNSKTLRVGVQDFKSHSFFLKIWCSGYMPYLFKRLTKTHSYFMLIFNYFFYECWVLLGVIVYLSVASFCSSSYSMVGETKGVDFFSFVTKFKSSMQQIFSHVYSTISIWSSYMERYTKFS